MNSAPSPFPADFAPLAPTPDVAEAWMSMRHLQRAMVFMKAKDMDVAAVLAEGGISADQLTDGDRKVPLAVFEAILRAAQQRYPDPLMGLNMADQIQPGTLGTLGHVLQACSTLGDLIDVAIRFNGLMSNVGHTSVLHSPGLVQIRWDCLAGSPMLRRQATEYIIGTFATLSRLLAPDSTGPLAVQFPHPRPDRPEHLRACFHFFGCPVHFDQPFAAITTTAARLQMPLPHGDAVLKDMLERHAQYLLGRRHGAPSVTDDVRRLLKGLILAGTPTKEAVAVQLGTSTRSLHRRLEEAGTSYTELLDKVRLALAREQLDAGEAPTADIANRLGFSSPQAFMRWFRQLVGVTPSQYRNDLKGMQA